MQKHMLHASIWPCYFLLTMQGLTKARSVHKEALINLILHYITLYYIILHYITLHYIMSYYVILHYITLYCITLYYNTLCYTTIYYIVYWSPWSLGKVLIACKMRGHQAEAAVSVCGRYMKAGRRSLKDWASGRLPSVWRTASAVNVLPAPPAKTLVASTMIHVSRIYKMSPSRSRPCYMLQAPSHQAVDERQVDGSVTVLTQWSHMCVV